MDLRLLLIIVSLALAPLLAQAAAIPSYFVDFDLATETHDDLYTARRKLDAVLRRTNLPPYDPPDVAGRVILGVRRPEFVGAPLKWIMIRVRIGQGAETTLAVAHDDLNLFGFKNGAGKWYIAEGGYKGLPGSSTALPFGLNYGELLGFPGGHELLCTVPLGNQSAVEAVRTLAGYSPAATADEQVKQAFVRFVVMVSEAMRFRPIREAFSQRWEQESFITREQAKYVVFWGKLSRHLLKWRESVLAIANGSEEGRKNPQKQERKQRDERRRTAS